MSRYRSFVISFLILAVLLTAGMSFAENSTTAISPSKGINSLPAVDPIGHSEGFSAVLYDNTSGLPTSEANAIVQTSDGFIWIGSYAGLIRYDGNTFVRMDSTSGLTSVKCLYVDSQDRLWVGTNDTGVAVMEKGRLRKWGKLDGMNSAHIRAITEDQNGIIYVATTSGIALIDQDGNLRMMEDERLAEANMRTIEMMDDGMIYGLTSLGDVLTIKNGEVVNYISVSDNNIAGGIGVFYPDLSEPGVVYVQGADYGFYRARLGENLTVIEQIDIQSLSYVQTLKYIDGRLWIGATNGIGVLENGEFHIAENLPMTSSIGSIMVDYLGNLWFTSTRQGVMKIVPNQFSDLFQRFGLPVSVVNTTCLCEDKLFIGSDSGLMVLDDNGPVSSLPLKKAVTISGEDLETTDLIELLSGCRIRSIIRDSNDQIWISIWRKYGLLRYAQGEVTAFTTEDGLLSTSLRSVAEKEDGSILVALTGGANVIEGNRVIASYNDQNGITTTESLTISEGFNGEIVLGSNGGGLYLINDSGTTNINVEDGLPSDVVLRLKRDVANNVVWIVCSSAIAYMTPDHRITTIKEFPYANNFDLYENSRGDMWILASNGIYVVPTKELLANGKINPVYYSLANGMPCITTANSYSALSGNGDLYIAGNTGVCKVNIEADFEDVNDLKATVPFIEADGQTLYPDSSGIFTIPSETQKLTVPSFVFNYSLSNPQVSYQLVGLEHQSTTVSRSDMVPIDYTNLRGGTYTYTMLLKDAMGRSNKTVSVQINKEKAFYEQTWFYILSGLLILIILTMGIRFYVRKKTLALEKKHRETTTLIEEITEAFAKVIDMKDRYTNGHSFRVAKLTRMLSEELGYDQETVEKYYRIALLHDIGKIGVPQEVLNKPGKLTNEEFEAIKSHTSKGYDVLKDISIMPELAIGAQSHHERPDGMGYPNHLKGDEIPRVAQIIAVADCFDAMYSNRPYRKRMNYEKVVSIIKEVSGTQLTSDVVDAFVRLSDRGLLRDSDDDGGGSMETVDNIRKKED
ncbi:MAG: HD domain-containing protein [Clostridia bacterium]|nr:HD domain-containing protein [Clostridia bacterium]